MLLLCLISTLIPALVRPEYQSSCHQDQALEESCDRSQADREYLRSWIDDIFSPHFVATPHSQSEHCDSVLEVKSCSWGECDQHFSGPGTITLTDGSLVTGSVREGIMSGPVNMTLLDLSLLQGWLSAGGCLSGVETVPAST